MMLTNERTDFCTQCRKVTGYTLQEGKIEKTIKGKEYLFNITVAVCNECGAEMNISGLIDKNIREIDEQYRADEGIVSVEDIEKVMKLYKIGKAPLSIALGFGEITLTRYLSGQIPSKEYSTIIREALSSPTFMLKKLDENKNKMALAAYNKSVNAATQLKNLFSVSDKMLSVISYVFKKQLEVTPFMLQKLLYFIQGMSFALKGVPMFKENCQAWKHGPVYPDVYYLFRDFKYNPVEDMRFAIFEGSKYQLSNDEHEIIDLVIDTFGIYGGKVLESITHQEQPWKMARNGYGDGIPSQVPISKENIKEYYAEQHKTYNFSSKKGIKKYIKAILQ